MASKRKRGRIGPVKAALKRLMFYSDLRDCDEEDLAGRIEGRVTWSGLYTYVLILAGEHEGRVLVLEKHWDNLRPAFGGLEGVIGGYNRSVLSAVSALRSFDLVSSSDEAAFHAWFRQQERKVDRESKESKAQRLAGELGYRLVKTA